MITETQQGKTTRPELFEMLEKISDTKSRKEKVELVKTFARYACFTDYLRCVFDARIVFALPEGRPPFEAAAENAVPSSWHRQNTQLAYFVKGLKGERLTGLKRESMFINLLESVHPADAEALVLMIAKKSAAKGLTEKLVREALPNLLS